MAITNSVQQIQHKLIQQENITSEQAIFNKKFGDAAFNALKSKYSRLVPYVVMFKVISSDVEKGFGLGTFIVKNGAEVVYLPVVLSGGNIVSCEIIYNKKEDSMVPLIAEEVDSILDATSIQGPTLSKKAPMVEDTTALYKTLFNPPSRSNVALASSSVKIQELPNNAKEIVTTYLQDNPETLAKIAQFYPIQALAEKLALTLEKEAANHQSVLEGLLRVEDLTKEAMQQLTKEDKEEALKYGYIIKQAKDTKGINVVSTKTLPVDVVMSYTLTEKPAKTKLYGTGYLFTLNGMDIEPKKALFIGDSIITKDGISSSPSNSVVISDFKEGVTQEDLRAFKGVTISEFTPHVPREHNSENAVPSSPSGVNPEDKIQYYSIFIPISNQTYKEMGKDYYATEVSATGIKKNIDGTWYYTPRYSDRSYGFTKALKAGKLDLGNNSYMLPMETMLVPKVRMKPMWIKDLSALYAMILRSNVKLKLVDNGAGTTLIDSTNKGKTKRFNKEADLAEYLINTYNFTKEAKDLLIEDKEVLLVKEAFIPDVQTEGSNVQNNPVDDLSTTGHAAENPYTASGGGTESPEVNMNQSILESAIRLQQPDLVDTGILASLSQTNNIKLLLIDSLNNFESTLTELGKSILMFSANKDEVEGHYGKEKYTDTLGNIRDVFTKLGKVVNELKKYTNMQ